MTGIPVSTLPKKGKLPLNWGNGAIRLPPRTLRRLRNSVPSIWSLPEELVVYLLRGLHITDLLSMRSTHRQFRDLIDSSPCVWTDVNFCNKWPTHPNIQHFERASEHGNIEALVKLGVAYLYNEGLPGEFQGQKISSNGEQAAAMFCKVESLTPQVTPFTWLFIRPPWATAGACCKECVFNNMRQFSSKTKDISVQVCVARILLLLEEDVKQTEALIYLDEAAKQGALHAAYLLWQQRHKKKVLDAADELHCIRELREVAALGDPSASQELCHFYAQGKYGGISMDQAGVFVKDFMQASLPSRINDIYRNKELAHSMRYILVDWLVEVAGMKDFGSVTLHAAISVVDRFLRAHQTSRSQLQLLGVAAMVLCSRFLGKDIITIREAAWLTDNTYKYEDVVRMMGEITATLGGKLKTLTSLDYVEIIGIIAGNDRKTQCVAEFMCELALLQSDLGNYPQALLAASCVLLSRLTNNIEDIWPKKMEKFTGFSLHHLTHCTLHLHDKCFLESPLVDHREVVLQAVKTRYADERFCFASLIQTSSREEIFGQLGVSLNTHVGREVTVRYRSEQELIMSPSRNKNCKSERRSNLGASREAAATPEPPSFNESTDEPNISLLSGYDGDQEEDFENDIMGDADSEDDSEIDMSTASDWDTSSLFSPGSSHGDLGWQRSEMSPEDNNVVESEASSEVVPNIRINLPVGSANTHTQPNGPFSPNWTKNISVFADNSGISIYFDPKRLRGLGLQQSVTVHVEPKSTAPSASTSLPSSESVSMDSGMEVTLKCKNSGHSQDRKVLQTINGQNSRTVTLTGKSIAVKRKNTQELGNENKR